jgi:lipopolysaccharide transport system ATP-binding protein
MSERPNLGPVAIEAEGLGKTYTLGELSSVISRASRTLRRGGDSAAAPAPAAPFNALRDVSFSLRAGECMAILGENGSGKSTLVQLIAGITVPNAGLLRVRGRVLPLLEVGAVFHDELTGRENVFLLGAILGIPMREVKAAVDDIIAFAGVEQHFDTPLKRYSTGMKARLSFGTAIFFPADIYVFDEVLAVVDDDFRDQCVVELRRLNAESRTIIFMSHDLSLVTAICNTGMWLEKGRVRAVGPMQDVASQYATSAERARAREEEAKATARAIAGTISA